MYDADRRLVRCSRREHEDDDVAQEVSITNLSETVSYFKGGLRLTLISPGAFTVSFSNDHRAIFGTGPPAATGTMLVTPD